MKAIEIYKKDNRFGKNKEMGCIYYDIYFYELSDAQKQYLAMNRNVAGDITEPADKTGQVYRPWIKAYVSIVVDTNMANNPYLPTTEQIEKNRNFVAEIESWV